MKADKQFEKLGFVKINDNDCIAIYSKYNNAFRYNHQIAILNKQNSSPLIQSYESKLNSDANNNVVGMTYAETKAAVKKLREMSRQHKWSK